MGTIIPTGIVNLLKGVPLDNKYNETVYVTGTQQSQVANFLASYQYLTFNNHEYQRVSEGVLRLNAQIANVYNVNYMIFRNMGTGATYEDHWFFAFVTKVEYVNERAVNIYYEIDVFQTYCLDWTLEPCMVERTHTTTDGIGEYLATEPFDLGLTVCTNTQEGGEGLSNWFSQNRIILFIVPQSTPDPDNPDADEPSGKQGYLIDGVYTGLLPVVYDATISGVPQLNNLLQHLIDASAIDRVVAIVEFPAAFLPDGIGETVVINSTPRDLYVARPTTVDGYTPKNNKLLTAPYIFFNVDVQTDSKSYRYELFTNPARCHFWCTGALSPNPEITIVPYGYNKTTVLTPSTTDSLIMDGFPQCGFAIDGYRAYLAQKAVDYQYQQASRAVTFMTQAGQGLMSAAMENPSGMLAANAGMVQTAIGAGQAMYDNACEQNKGSSARGSLNSAGLFGLKHRGIFVRHMSITAEKARMIDDFFTRFGYSIGRIQMPNLAARKAFTYIKTNGMSIRGAIPADDMAKINSCFDHGITFFRTLANVGDYSVDNTL